MCLLRWYMHSTIACFWTGARQQRLTTNNESAGYSIWQKWFATGTFRSDPVDNSKNESTEWNISGGYGDDIVNALVEKVHTTFTVMDVMEHIPLFSIHHALQVFEDISN